MSIQLITLIPAVASMFWAFSAKMKYRQFNHALIFSVLALFVLLNAFLVYIMITDGISVGWHIVQMAAGSCIIPLSYMFFSQQAGRVRNNSTTIILWVLAALSFVPQIFIYNPFKPFSYPDHIHEPFAVVIFQNGVAKHGLYTGDLVVILQAIVSIGRIIPFIKKIRDNNLRLNPKVYAFLIWWGITIIAAIMMSSMTYEDLRSPLGKWFYFITYSLIVTAINVLLALRFDLSPVQNEKGEDVKDVNVYVQQQYGAMAVQLKELVEGQKLYLEPHCTSEEIVKQLHTNRTYFSQMMSSKIGMTFPEYVNSLRLAHAEDLLRNTDLTIADVATQCGYNDSGYLGRKFKERHGESPSEWRKKITRE